MSRFAPVFLLLIPVLTACRIEGLRQGDDENKNAASTGSTTGSGGEGGEQGTQSGGTGSSTGGGTTSSGGSGGQGPQGEWVPATGNLVGRNTQCAVSLLTPSPHEDLLITGLSDSGLWKNTGGDKRWKHLATGSASEPIANEPRFVLFDPDDPKTFWEAGSGGPGLYVTRDGGDTFMQVGDIEGVDYLSIDFSDPDRNTLLAGAEERLSLYLSVDAGETWTDLGPNLPEDCTWTDAPYVLDPETYLLGCDGILRSDDAGETWQRVSYAGGVGLPLRTKNGDFFWSSVNVEGLVRSTDEGESWQRVTAGQVLYPTPPIELPDGRLVAAGTTALMVSDDAGNHWEPLSPELPYVPQGIAFAKQRGTFYIWEEQCNDEVVGDEILSYDYEQ